MHKNLKVNLKIGCIRHMNPHQNIETCRFNPGYQISNSIFLNACKLQLNTGLKGHSKIPLKKSEKNLQNVARNSHPREYQRIIPTKYVVTKKDQLFWLNLIQFFPSEKKVKCSIKVTIFMAPFHHDIISISGQSYIYQLL